MTAKHLELTNFRNYEQQSVEFGDRVNIIFGDNAQGKTNILESVYFFAMGRSNRVRRDAELIKHGENFARLKLVFSDSSRDNTMEAEIFRDKRKRICVNEIPIKRNSELVRRFNVVYFGPEYLGIVKGGPKLRRQNMDMLISQIKPGYLAALGELRKIVESKNALLRMEHPNLTMLDIMDDKLAAAAANIILCRAVYAKKIEQCARELQREISGGSEELELRYECCIGDVSGFDLQKAEQAVREKLAEARSREIRLCEAAVGPHREDISFWINGTDARLYASQGQQKTIVMTEKLAEAALIREETSEIPVLLLDDIMSEFDKSRREYILRHIDDMQILITCTDTEGLTVPDDAVRIEVSGGRAERV